MDFSEIGVTSYYYDLEPSGGRLRKSAEDFIVEEEFDRLAKKEDGRVLVLKVKAKNWEHNRLIAYIARANHVSSKRVYFAGTKDRRSVKIQYFSIPGVKFREFSLDDVEILDHFYLDSPLTVGTHAGNRFNIKVTDCNPDVFSKNCGVLKEKGISPNYYGPQRFGALRPVTHLVGRQLVKGNYREAVRLFVGFPGEDRFRDIRQSFYEDPDPSKFYEQFPESLDLERKVMNFLIYHEEDYIGAIRQLPENLVSMFIHAYQGYVFNKILSDRIELREDVMAGDVFSRDGDLIHVSPMNLESVKSQFERGEGSPTGLVVGYDVEISRGKMEEIEERVLSSEGLRPQDFKMPFNLKSRGERRNLYFKVADISCKSSTIEFFLPPGSYATSVLREIIRSNEMEVY